MKCSCVELVSTSPLSLVGRRREAGRVFDIGASYASYSFVVVSWLKTTDAVGTIVLIILYSLSKGSWM